MGAEEQGGAGKRQPVNQAGEWCPEGGAQGRNINTVTTLESKEYKNFLASFAPPRVSRVRVLAQVLRRSLSIWPKWLIHSLQQLS